MMNFHEVLAANASYRATMLIEPLLGTKFGPDSVVALVRNMQNRHLDSAINTADDLIRLHDSLWKALRICSYDQVIQEIGPEVIARSAHRALAAVPAGTVMDGHIADALHRALTVELSYLWLKACERFYEHLCHEGGADQLCEDEGCPHHGTPHVCISRVA